jgi:antitoxin VapB
MNIQERDIHMPLYIRDDEVDLLAAELQSVSGARTKTEAVRIALQNEIKRKRAEMPLIDRIARIQEKVRKLGPRDPDFDMKKFSDELSGDI